MSKVIITAAGTGGHVFPGLAVARYLNKKGYEVHWIGGNGMEAQIVPKHGIEFQAVDFSAVRGKGIIKLLKAPFKLINAIKDSKKILQQLKPDMILAMGGYISVPVGIAARLMNIPLVIHEQNAIAGMANRLLTKIATKTLVGFDNALPNSIYTGNPIRENFNIEKEHSKYEGNINLLVIGGSLGASILNEVVPLGLEIAKNSLVIKVVHQSGKKHMDSLIKNYQNTSVPAHTVDFIEDMKAAYEWADLIVCRAGAMTISEISTVGLPSILVPYPHAVDDHQTKNAQILAKAKAAWLVPQKQFTPQKLANILQNLNPEKLRQMSLKAKLHSHQNATQKVGDICIEVIQNYNKRLVK